MPLLRWRWSLPALALAFVTGASGCSRLGVKGSGVAKSETRSVDPFDRIEIEGQGKLTVTLGPSSPLAVTADDNTLPLLQTEVKEGRLKIWFTERIRPQVTPTFTVTVPDLAGLRCVGAVDAKLTGVGNEELRLHVEGAANVEATGRTQNLVVDAVGASALRAEGLEAASAEVNLTGAGSADVHVIEKLDVSIIGAGSVTYDGDPELAKQIVGFGSINRREPSATP